MTGRIATTPSVSAEPELLRATEIAKKFGATTALRAADLVLRRGEVHALLGGNGAGKSTLIGILEGRITPDGGAIERHARIAVVHQELAVLPDLTVAENIALTTAPRTARFRWTAAGAVAEELLAVLGLAEDGITPLTLVGDLALHHRQLVEIARALASGAELVLLDEPTASLTTAETGRLFEVLRGLGARGIGMVLVSHRMHEIRRVCDRVTVLRDGRSVLADCPIGDVADDDILDAMFGSRLAGRMDVDDGVVSVTPPPAAGRPGATPAIGVLRHIDGLSLPLQAGHVLGVAGTPAGPARLFASLLGERPAGDWVLEVDGVPRRPRSPRAAVRSGVGFISGDRAGKGVFPHLDVHDNVVLAGQVHAGSVARSPKEPRRVAELSTRLGFPTVDPRGPVTALSGGTAQKAIIARWVDVPLRLLLLEEPTRGVDLRTKTDLYERVRAIAAGGTAVVWWSTEHSELLLVADEVLTFDVTGSPVTVTPIDRLDEGELLAQTGTT